MLITHKEKVYIYMYIHTLTYVGIYTDALIYVGHFAVCLKLILYYDSTIV